MMYLALALSCALLRSAEGFVGPRNIGNARRYTRAVDASMVFGRVARFLRRSVGRLRGPDSPSIEQIPQVSSQVLVIGAGVSGLACANELIRLGIQDVIVVESSNEVGGRIRTDLVDGYLLDRGFQVFIDSYPLAEQLFNYSELSLASFNPGAVVRIADAFHIVSDPFRRPQDILESLISPIGSLPDKLIVGIMSVLIRFKSNDDIFSSVETSTLASLRSRGLTDSMIERFFTPFFQGIFLSSLEAQSSRMFEFVFKMFTTGSATLPSSGMGAIPKQLANRLPKGVLSLNTKVTRVRPGVVDATVSTGGSVEYACSHVVLATEAPVAKSLLAEAFVDVSNGIQVSTPRMSTCVYFGIDGAPPLLDPVLVLNGDNVLPQALFDSPGLLTHGDLRINNVCFPSQVSSTYAPSGSSLASITVLGDVSSISDDAIVSAVRSQLVAWWGATALKWTLLRVYRIPYAQPAQVVPYAVNQSPRLAPGLYCCGDHRGSATLNGAIGSALAAAAAVAEDIRSGAGATTIAS